MLGKDEIRYQVRYWSPDGLRLGKYTKAKVMLPEDGARRIIYMYSLMYPDIKVDTVPDLPPGELAEFDKQKVRLLADMTARTADRAKSVMTEYILNNGLRPASFRGFFNSAG